MNTISGKDWRDVFRRFEPNLVSAQISLIKERKVVVKYVPVQHKDAPVGYQCIYENGVSLGSIEQEVDGFYYFWPILRGGYWESHILRDIANKLDALNEAWKQKIEREIGPVENESQ